MSAKTMSDFELRIRGEITAEEYVRRLKERVRHRRAQLKPRDRARGVLEKGDTGPVARTFRGSRRLVGVCCSHRRSVRTGPETRKL